MAVDDLWYLTKRGPDGERLPSKRHGRGKRWRVRWVDDNGSPCTRFFEKKSDAERHDANVRADLSRGQYVDERAGRITVAKYAEQWRAAQLHMDTTALHVEKAFRLHVNPVIGGVPMGKVKPGQIQSWVKSRTDLLAPTTLRVVYSYLNSMFAAASRDRVIGPSPCVGIRLPELPRGAHFIPTPEQVHGLADALPSRFSALVYVAAGCGLRLGEAFGLEIGDVDFLRREIHVRRQLKLLTGRKPYLGPTKTKTSVRTVELPEVVGLALARHLESYGPTTVELDDETDPRRRTRRTADLVFTSTTKQPIQRPSWSRMWAPVARAAGMPERWGYHGLRHYYATLLIHAGASVKTVQMSLGHSSPTITLNTYTHEWPDALDRTRSLVDAALGRRQAVTPAVSRG